MSHYIMKYILAKLLHLLLLIISLSFLSLIYYKFFSDDSDSDGEIDYYNYIKNSENLNSIRSLAQNKVYAFILILSFVFVALVWGFFILSCFLFSVYWILIQPYTILKGKNVELKYEIIAPHRPGILGLCRRLFYEIPYFVGYNRSYTLYRTLYDGKIKANKFRVFINWFFSVLSGISPSIIFGVVSLSKRLYKAINYDIPKHKKKKMRIFYINIITELRNFSYFDLCQNQETALSRRILINPLKFNPEIKKIYDVYSKSERLCSVGLGKYRIAHLASTEEGSNNSVCNIWTTHPIKGQNYIGCYGNKANSVTSYNNIVHEKLISLDTRKVEHIINDTGARNQFMLDRLRTEANFMRNMNPLSPIVYQYPQGNKTRSTIFQNKNIYSSYLEINKEYNLNFDKGYIEKLSLLSNAYSLMTDKELEMLEKVGLNFKLSTLERSGRKFISVKAHSDGIYKELSIYKNKELHRDTTLSNIIKVVDNPLELKDVLVYSAEEYHKSGIIINPSIDLF